MGDKRNHSSQKHISMLRLKASLQDLYLSSIAPTTTVPNMGVIVASEMSMKAHVSSINRSAYPQLKNVRTPPFILTNLICFTFKHIES